LNHRRPLSAATVRAELDDLAATTLGRPGPLPDGDLAEHLDSMARLSLVVAIEDHFRVAFDPEDEQEIRTADDVVALIVRKLGDELGRAGA
jgi:acyl carrier protein